MTRATNMLSTIATAAAFLFLAAVTLGIVGPGSAQQVHVPATVDRPR